MRRRVHQRAENGEVNRVEKFRYKYGLKVPYHRQGYIYFVSRSYKQLPKAKRERIEGHCRQVGGEYWAALFEFVTSDTGSVATCMHHYISESLLKKLVKRYYEEFPRDI